MDNSTRLISFYLPQFHAIPENDEWWGKGFTEWTNVKKAKPLFPGHYQPHEPGELGYYDLLDPSVREAQAALAKEYGIYGFCYYHYWFNGRRLLERPFNEVLSSGKPDLPFCLCWANENWTRAWDGMNEHVLMAQKYCEDDDRRHIRWLIGAFRDKRYIRVNGKPIFLVYRASLMPDPSRTASIWREEAAKSGIGEIFLCKVESYPEEGGDPSGMGFDAAVQFPPNWRTQRVSWVDNVLSFGKHTLSKLMPGNVLLDHRVADYQAYAERDKRLPKPGYKRFPGVMPGWDNSPRRQSRAAIFKGSSPEIYGAWLEEAIRRSMEDLSGDERMVFINAWNEWGEGNHIEPCQKWGRAYLEATRKALCSASGK